MTEQELELIRLLEWMRGKFSEEDDNPTGVVLENCDGIDVRVWMKNVDACIARSRMQAVLRG